LSGFPTRAYTALLLIAAARRIAKLGSFVLGPPPHDPLTVKDI
jgi:hypothetical protein